MSKRWIGYVVVALLAVVALASGVPEREGRPVSLACEIQGNTTCLVGQAPKIHVALRNLSSRPIYLVGSLDGSAEKWRYPYCYFEVIGPDGQSAVQRVSRCGNTNTLRPADFFQVPAGRSFDPFQNVDSYGFFSAHQIRAENFTKPGEYRIRFFYSSASSDIKEWGGDGAAQVAADAGLLRLFRVVPKLQVQSEEFRLTVVAPAG
jgi:hypothetical protein